MHSSWLEGNRVQHNTQGSLVNYTYYTEKAFQDADGIASIQLLQNGRATFPVKNKNLLKSATYSNFTYNYVYEFDNAGKITRRYEIYTTDKPIDTAIYYFEYTCK